MLTANGQIAEESQVAIRDLVQLNPLNEETLLLNLQLRYKKDQIYTFLGSLLISINPFKRLAYYSPSLISQYQDAACIDDLPPHVYSLTHHVYRCMLQGDSDQAIIVTGEAASGKTENAKIALQYLVCSGTLASELLREQLINANFVLEAFGNASTLHNDNSSRFGKFLQIEFDFKGDPVGGSITCYMLEKSRAAPVKGPGERTFHIFYQLLAGASVSLLNSLKLQRSRSVDHYHLLRPAKCSSFSQPFELSALNEFDKNNLSITTRALEVVGFTREQIDSTFAILAAIIHLYNVTFQAQTTIDGVEGVSVTNEEHLYDAAELLGIQDSLLEAALTSKSFESNRKDLLVGEVTCQEAAYLRDSTCRTLYSRLFAWIVCQMNECLKVRGRSGVRVSRRNCIGILDVYGFDVLTENSLEQFLINYSNEKLQQFYIDHEFKMTQEEYLREAIQWKPIDYFDNSIIIDLIESNILPLIDEESTITSQHEATCCHMPSLSSHCSRVHPSSSCFSPCFPRTGRSILLSQLGASSSSSSSSSCPLTIAESDECLLLKLNKLCSPYFECCSVSTMSAACHSSSLPALLSASMVDLTRCGATAGPTVTPPGSRPPSTSPLGRMNSSIGRSGASSSCNLAHEASLATEMDNHCYLATCFRLRHYAGTVTYCVRGFCDKNNDLTCPMVACALYHSNKPIVQRMFPEGNPRRSHVKRPSTLACQLRISLGALLGTLSSKRAHFIKCIKPNEERRAHLFHLPLVQHQVRYMLLLESSKLRRCGFVYSCDYESFLARYKLISPHTWPVWRALPIEGVTQLLKELPHSLSSCDFAFGRTKLFVKTFSTLAVLEEMRLRALHSLACIIQKTWRQYDCTRKFMALKNAHSVIASNYRSCKRRKWLLWLCRHLPSTSPLAREWPSSPRSLRLTNCLLRKLYHKNRCLMYRARLDHSARARMREKLTASLLFKDRKMTYYASVPHPFLGEYVSIRRNEKFKRLAPDLHVVFADIVNKVSRSSGKSIQKLLVVSTSGILVLDHRTLDIKYTIPVEEIDKISVSPFADDLLIMHVSSLEPGTGRRRGVLIFQSVHLIEIVSKLFLVIQNATQQTLLVEIASQIQCNFGREDVTVSFRCAECVSSSVVKITRRTGRMDVLLTS